jgi:Flp pilus assembly pilin Flp
MDRLGQGVGRLARRLRRRLGGELGAVATEYGLLLLFVALAIIAALTAFGLAVLRLFQAGAGAFP